MRALRACAATLALLTLSSCVVGPDYRKPDVSELVPTDWRWKVAAAADAKPKGEWWKVFDDPALDALEARALAGNPHVRAAIARVDQARAAARLTRAQFFPELTLDATARRERTSGNLPTPIPFPVPSANLNTFSVPLDLSYEIDLWGRVRRAFESATAQAQASASDYENVLLTLTADVAVNYFLVRALDAEIATLRSTLETRRGSLRILEERYAAGVTQGADVEQAKTLLAASVAELAEVSRRRAETLHALALLCGAAPGAFELPETTRAPTLASVPAGVPATLLERRPDIARAERELVARNAQIGVARAAYFPSIALVGEAGFLSDEARSLFASDSRVWSIGPRVRIPLFTAGRTAANVERAQAAYEEAVADYRLAVLAAFREVEDSLVQIASRAEQARAQGEALRAARKVLALAQARYDAGTVNYLEVADAERNVLEQARRQAQLEGQRFAAAVRLIKALGGGW